MRSKTIFFLTLLLICQLFTISSLGQKNVNAIYYGNKKASIYAISLYKGGSALAIADSKSINLYNTTDQSLISTFQGEHNDLILSIDISSDSAYLVSAGKDGVIVLWDIAKNTAIQKLDYHEGIITSVIFSPDARYIISGSSDKQVIIYDIFAKKITHKCSGHTDHITSVAMSSDGKTIASTSIDKSIKFWDILTGKLISSISNFKACQRSLKFSNDKTHFYSCGDNSKITIWNIQDLNNIFKFNEIKYSNNWLLSLDITKRGNSYATASLEGRIVIKHPFGKYWYKLNRPISKIIFMPEKKYLNVIVATIGGGVMQISAKDMKLKTL